MRKKALQLSGLGPWSNGGRDVLGLVAALLLAACAKETSDASRSVTYERDIRPLLERNCTTCHTNGGIAPFVLDQWPSDEVMGPQIVAAVTSGVMPPWRADPSCHPLRDVLALDDADKSAFARWREGGYQRGDPADYRPPEPSGQSSPAELGEPTLLLDPAEAYVPPTNVTDEYRCFMANGTFDTDTYVTAMDIRPGNKQVVHHVQMHVIPASSIATAEQLDAAAQGAGYPCAAGIAGSYNMFSWRPGGRAVTFDPGDAGLIDAGSRIELQVHYNMEHIAPGTVPDPDLTEVALWTLPAGELPDRIVRRKGIVAFPLTIPAGDPDVVAEQTWPSALVTSVSSNLAWVPAEMIGQTPHMHALGTRLSVTRTDDAGNSMCLIDTPNWSFVWQMDYAYASDALVPLGPNDTLTVRCEYDNSPEHQQLDINGQPRVPRDVGWGEGTSDEMCLNYVWLRYDRQVFLGARQ